MIATTRKLLLLSISALTIFAFAPVLPHGSALDAGSAYARGGGDDHGGGGDSDSDGGGRGGGSSSSGGSGRGGSDDGAGHDSGDDHGGGRHSSSDDDGADDHSGRHGRHRGDDDMADNDDDSNDDNGGRRDRPSVEISVTDASLQGLLNGSLRAVDNLGRTLEIEVETEHGAQVVIGKVHGGDATRRPGAITAVTIVNAN